MQYAKLLMILCVLLANIACNTPRAPTADIDRALSPSDLASKETPEEVDEEPKWTPQSRNLMEDIPAQYRAAARAQFGDALEADPILDWFDHGLEAYQEADYEEAERSFLKVLENLPEFHPVTYNLGLTYYHQKRYAEAIDTFENLIKGIEKTGVDDISLSFNPEILQHTQLNLGMSYLQAGQPTKAVGMFSKLMPDETAHYNLIVAYNELKDYPKVIESMQQFAEVYADDAQLRNLQGLAHYRLEQYEEALQVFEAAAELDPEDAQIWVNVGLLRLDMKQYDEATAAFTKAKQLNPELDVDQYITQLKQVDRRQARIHYNQAVEFYGIGKVDAAITQWKQAVQYDPGFLEAHINLAAAYTNQRRIADAIGHLEQAIKLDTKSFEAHYNLGVAHFQLRHYQDAIRVLTQALKLKPDYPEAQFTLGMAFHKDGKPESALAPLRRATELKPTWLDPGMNLGLILGSLERNDEAIRAFQTLLKYHPRNSDAYYNLGVLHLDKGNREEAITAFERAVMYNSMNTRALTMLEQLKQ